MAAFLVITFLTLAAVSVSGGTQELSTTVTSGDTVNITCPVEEGTLRYIFMEWYSNDSTGKRLIFKLVDGDMNITPEYENRASLPEDYSKLILKEITVADEGTYRCGVETLKQTVPSTFKTKLNVFSLRPDTLPVISPKCTGTDESSSCIVRTNQSFTLTCALPNVYPVEETKLIWYQDGKRVSFTDKVNTQNDDGTADISRHIQVSDTGNFTCNATYLSANGRENTAVSVEAWVIPSADVPNTPGKNTCTTSCLIVGIICICIGLLVATITRFVCMRLKAKDQRSFRRDENESDEAGLNQGLQSFRRDENQSDETGLNQGRQSFRRDENQSDETGLNQGRRSFRRDGNESDETRLIQGRRSFRRDGNESDETGLKQGRRSFRRDGNESDETGLKQGRQSFRRDKNESDETGLKQGRQSFRRVKNESDETGLKQDESSASLPSSVVRRRNVNRTYPVTPSSLDILEIFIRSGLHPNGYRRVVWPKQMTVVCLIDYPGNSKDIVIKHNTPQLQHAEEILIEYINSELDKTKIKSITLYLNYSSCTQCSRNLQILKKEIPDLQIKFSALHFMRRQSCTESCACHTADPESFKMLRKLDARPFQKDDWDDLIDLLRKDDEKKGNPTSNLHGLRYGDMYGVWRNEEDDKMLADYRAAVRECQRT